MTLDDGNQHSTTPLTFLKFSQSVPIHSCLSLRLQRQRMALSLLGANNSACFKLDLTCCTFKLQASQSTLDELTVILQNPSLHELHSTFCTQATSLSITLFHIVD